MVNFQMKSTSLMNMIGNPSYVGSARSSVTWKGNVGRVNIGKGPKNLHPNLQDGVGTSEETGAVRALVTDHAKEAVSKPPIPIGQTPVQHPHTRTESPTHCLQPQVLQPRYSRQMQLRNGCNHH